MVGHACGIGVLRPCCDDDDEDDDDIGGFTDLLRCDIS